MVNVEWCWKEKSNFNGQPRILGSSAVLRLSVGMLRDFRRERHTVTWLRVIGCPFSKLSWINPHHLCILSA